jgi:hypothetical protein
VPHAAIKSTPPLGTVAVEPQTGDKGKRFIWLEPQVVTKLRLLRGPGENYSDVILKLAAVGQSH